MATLALLLKIIGAVSQVSSVIYIITAIIKKKKGHVRIGLILLVIACILLVIATRMEDRFRAGY
ncbi:hypothetical protein GNP94_14960 [Paenibacillus campinasensis]|jgi:ABC-type uncharacterized transport system permease subunit|uniref:Uncharacterized protein n=1 Tax=Paenibacillus campinasensis TaxID=66347 RepID=A0ABW9T3J9_9BACL|nr:hypothetical protein [Paenibacillus campinasensis]MUG67287.1 hypothetical protein [Paenibacillus campinasensis]